MSLESEETFFVPCPNLICVSQSAPGDLSIFGRSTALGVIQIEIHLLKSISTEILVRGATAQEAKGAGS